MVTTRPRHRRHPYRSLGRTATPRWIVCHHGSGGAQHRVRFQLFRYDQPMLAWTIIASVAAAISAVVAAWTLIQIRKDSADSARPYVAAELRKPPFTRGVQYLIIRNYGKTEARSLVVSFDPPIPDPAPEKAAESVTPFLKRRYASPIAVLLPEQELSNVWFSGVPGGDGKFQNTEPTPDQTTVTLKYDGPEVVAHWWRRKQTPYVATFPIDVGLIRTQSSSESSTHPNRVAQDSLKELQNIASNISSLVYVLEDAVGSPPRQFRDPALGSLERLTQLFGGPLPAEPTGPEPASPQPT